MKKKVQTQLQIVCRESVAKHKMKLNFFGQRMIPRRYCRQSSRLTGLLKFLPNFNLPMILPQHQTGENDFATGFVTQEGNV